MQRLPIQAASIMSYSRLLSAWFSSLFRNRAKLGPNTQPSPNRRLAAKMSCSVSIGHASVTKKSGKKCTNMWKFVDSLVCFVNVGFVQVFLIFLVVPKCPLNCICSFSESGRQVGSPASDFGTLQDLFYASSESNRSTT